MNSMLPLVQHGGLILDCLGIIGLGLLALSALRLARLHHSWGGSLMAGGALALLLGRLFVVLAPSLFIRETLADFGKTFISLHAAIPVVLLSLGLAGVVWGLWGHERWMREGH